VNPRDGSTTVDDTTVETPEAEAPTVETPATESDSTDLGDAGKKALAAERAAKRAAEKRAAEAEARVKEFEDASKSEAEKAAARAEAAEKALAEMTAKALRLQVATEVGIPAELHEFLTGSDEESLRAQATKLAEIAATANGPRAPKPDPTQGAKPSSAGVSQLTQADAERMTPAEIVAAKAAGRFNDLLGIKS
jgi:hypothetical protein